ncbi:MAG: CBS domain-containing protein [Desulfuromonadaceae bacterium]|nr:CBS domain-containing protein [Desulfuromonadaceae bacterium]MDD2848425.1 CBS domain-containing protein [Desulfuromonadaceae bacterium]MDD4129946.1 CBS domain-containing protein [Desulfuromonadaceae bacterium]
MDVITTHTNADFDCLGAMTAALRLYPDALLSFPGSQEKAVRNFARRHPDYLPHFTRAKDINLETITRLIIVDCQQGNRIGRFAEILDRPSLEIHIYDHHPVAKESITPTGGEIAACGSASTLLGARLMEQGGRLSEEEATLIMLGIHEDTGRLLFASATPEDYRVAGWLLAQGARLNVVSDALTPELTKAQMGLLKRLLATLKTSLVNGVAISVAYASCDNYVGDIASLAHLMRDMENMDALFLVIAMEDHVYLVGRSHVPEIDVGEIMKAFQGGGHATAASAVVHNGSLKRVLEQLDGVLQLSVRGEVTAGSIMSSPVKTMPDSTSISGARELLTRYNCNAMPVVAEEIMIGVISRRTVEKALHHGLGDSPVTDFMHTEYLSATPDTPIADIQSYMVTGNRRFVPVFKGALLAGAVTRTDLMRHIYGGNRGQGGALYDLDSLEIPTRTRSVAGLLGKRLAAEIRETLHKLGEIGDGLGLSVYVVGGFVRDLLLGVDNLDIDVTVEGDGVFFAECFAERYGGRVRSHKKFGTAVLVLADGSKIDVASTRLEYYESPGVLPTVERSSLRHDLYRRDFTINTLAICINRDRFGHLTDYFGGQQDLQERVVRVMHNLSFVEDPTRVFRAIRFEQRLGFHIASHTENLIRSAVRMHLLDRLGGERLQNELVQILCEKDPLAAIERMSSFGLLAFIHPALKLVPATERVLGETRQVMAWFRLLYLEDRCEPWQVYFMALCDGLKPDEFREACGRLAIPGRLAVRLSSQRHLVFTTMNAIRRRLKQAGEIRNSQLFSWFGEFTLEVLLYLAARASSEEVRRFVSLYLTRLRSVVPLLGGGDLCGLGLEPGPVLGRVKERLLQARLDGEVNTLEEEEALARSLVQGHLALIKTC